jgi:hypothetical protein
VPRFIERAHDLYGYTNFVADTGGSLIEVIDHDNPENDPVVRTLTDNTVLLYIRGTEKDAAELVRRFKQSPKPMYYQPEFLAAKWGVQEAQRWRRTTTSIPMPSAPGASRPCCTTACRATRRWRTISATL